MKRLPAAATAISIAVAGGLVAMPSASASGEYQHSSGKILLLESDGHLSTRDSHLPLLAGHRVKIHGLNARDRLVGIDTRPATGELYGLGKSGQLYRVDAGSGRSSAVGAPAAGAVGTAVGLDFNPTVDRVRVVTSSGRNLRLHPDTGAVAAVDGALAYASGGRAPRVAAAAYTNSVAGATSTALYGLDAAKDALVTQGSLPGRTPVVSPNTGQLFPVGRLGIEISTVNGFDISGQAGPGAYDAGDYWAIAAVEANDHGLLGGLFDASTLVRIDLRTGRTTPLLALGLGEVVGLTFTSR